MAAGTERSHADTSIPPKPTGETKPKAKIKRRVPNKCSAAPEVPAAGVKDLGVGIATRKVSAAKALRRQKHIEEYPEDPVLVSVRPRARTDEAQGQKTYLLEPDRARPRALTCAENCPWGHPLYATELRGWLCDECGVMEPNGLRFECEDCNYCLCCECVHTLDQEGWESLRQSMNRSSPKAQSAESNEEISQQGSPKAGRCACGNIFEEWSQACRKCGEERGEKPPRVTVNHCDEGEGFPDMLQQPSPFDAEVRPSPRPSPRNALVDALRKVCWDGLPFAPPAREHPPARDRFDVPDVVQQKQQLAATSVDINGEGCVEYVYTYVEADGGEFSFGIPDHLRRMPCVADANVDLAWDGSSSWRRTM